ALQAGFAAVTAAPKTALTLVISQVLAIGIGLGQAQNAVTAVDIPTHEVDGIGEILAAGPAVAGLLFVLLPGAVQGLGVTVSGTDPRPGDDPEQAIARRYRIGAVARFLIDDGHG